MFKHFWKDERGEGSYVGLLVAFLVIMFIFATCITVIPPYMQYQRLNSLNEEYVDYLEGVGQANVAVTNTYLANLVSSYGLDDGGGVTASYVGTQFKSGNSGQIDLENAIVVTLTYETSVGVGTNGIIRLPLTIHSECYGRSERYWK